MKKYKEIVQMIIECNNKEDYNRVYCAIDRAFEEEKITNKDHEQLLDLFAKVTGGYRKGIKPYSED